MEMEAKLAFTDEKGYADVLSGDWYKPFVVNGSRRRIEMLAVYYDTEDGFLLSRGGSFRVRREGEDIVATVKSGGGVKGGFHTRKEWNVLLEEWSTDINKILTMPIETTDSINEFTEIMTGLKGRRLREACRNVFERISCMLQVKDSLIELCIDKGEMTAGGKSAPICEVELELHQGDSEILAFFTGQFAEQYALTAENRSKYARALALLKQ